jgi:hypothetical protein
VYATEPVRENPCGEAVVREKERNPEDMTKSMAKGV